MSPISTYSTVQMLQALESLMRPSKFLLDTFFPGVVTFDTQKISFDTKTTNLKMAPFVSPIVAGKAERSRGFNTTDFAPAYVKPKHQVDPTLPLVRQPGEAFGGRLSAGDRRNLVINQLLADERDQIDRRLEWMAAQILTTGGVTVAGDNYPTTQVDFGRDDDQTLTLAGANTWGSANISPYDDIDDWMDTVGESVGAAVDNVLLGKDAWKALRSDQKFLKALDRFSGQTADASLANTPSAPGTAQLKGTVGNVRFWTYNNIYEDDTGATQHLFDPDGVLLAASAAHAGFQGFGAILDGAAGYQPYQYFPKNWIENDPPVEFVMTQSAPLPVPGRPNATMYVKTA